MIYLRSTLLVVLLVPVTIVYGLVAAACFALPAVTRHRIISGWTDIALWLVRNVVGIRHRVVGAHNIPQRPSVILCKHQSAWETMGLQHIFPPQVYVLKKELLKLPFLGWGLAHMPMISIDRKAGKDALQQVVEQGRQRLAEGFWVVVFPEGTRVAPGVTRRFKAGGAWLAANTGAPVVPVAHNAGDFWRRNAFLKYPGTITVSVGPAIDPTGLSAEEINNRAAAWIDAEMRRLFPHQYAVGNAEETPIAR